jgi:hypothetical protein
MDDAALAHAITSLALRNEDFRHREHVRLAYALLLREGDLAAALSAFRALLKRFAAHAGAAAKYHETITCAYVVLISERMHDRAYASSAAFLADNPDLLDHRGGALARYYDVEALTASPRARAAFVLPHGLER